MKAPKRKKNCPPGLEYLTELDHLFVEEQIDVVKLLAGIESNKQYYIKNIKGENVFQKQKLTK